jgi:hypothetical protein
MVPGKRFEVILSGVLRPDAARIALIVPGFSVYKRFIKARIIR